MYKRFYTSFWVVGWLMVMMVMMVVGDMIGPVAWYNFTLNISLSKLSNIQQLYKNKYYIQFCNIDYLCTDYQYFTGEILLEKAKDNNGVARFDMPFNYIGEYSNWLFLTTFDSEVGIFIQEVIIHTADENIYGAAKVNSEFIYNPHPSGNIECEQLQIYYDEYDIETLNFTTGCGFYMNTLNQVSLPDINDPKLIYELTLYYAPSIEQLEELDISLNDFPGFTYCAIYQVISCYIDVDQYNLTVDETTITLQAHDAEIYKSLIIIISDDLFLLYLQSFILQRISPDDLECYTARNVSNCKSGPRNSYHVLGLISNNFVPSSSSTTSTDYDDIEDSNNNLLSQNDTLIIIVAAVSVVLFAILLVLGYYIRQKCKTETLINQLTVERTKVETVTEEAIKHKIKQRKANSKHSNPKPVPTTFTTWLQKGEKGSG